MDRTAHPTRDWLSFARTAAARNKIRRYLKTYEREINLQLGRERLDLALKTRGAAGLSVVRNDDFASLTPTKKYPTFDDVYVALGREDLLVETIMSLLVPRLLSRGDIPPVLEPVHEGNNGDGGSPHMASVKLAHCCCPLPGDAIVGFLNPHKGLIVHRSECRTLQRSRESAASRLVEVNWLQIELERYLAPISIVAHDRAGLLRDVAAVVSDAGINMTAVSSSTNTSLQKAIINATLEIEAVEQIEQVFRGLRQVKNVVSVSRALDHRVG